MRHEIVSYARYGLLALGVVASLLAATPAVPAPIHYDVDFTLVAGSTLPTAGGFDYDAALPAFSNFVVEWNGHTFDLTTAANAPAEDGGTAFSTSCGLTGAALSFALLSKASCIVQAADGFGPGWVADEVANSGASLFQFLATAGGPSVTELSVTAIVAVAFSQDARGTGDFQISARVPRTADGSFDRRVPGDLRGVGASASAANPPARGPGVAEPALMPIDPDP